MLHIFDFARELTVLSVAVRLVSAVIFGGLIGIEREFKRRPAGFRTHILICLGAAMTTLTSQYLYLSLHMYTDIARLGAQVISGIGFIGAGTIIVTKHQRVKGLTTAAGLWTDAIIGLVCGAGYIEGALVATVMVLVAEVFLIKLEYKFARQATDISLYVEYANPDCIERIVHILKEQHIKLNGLEISRTGNSDDSSYRYCAVLTLQTAGKKLDEEIIKSVTLLDGVILLEEL